MMSWEKVPLGAVITFQRGYDLPLLSLKEGNYPVITSSGLAGFHDEFKANGPGIVTGRYGTLGKMFYIQENFFPHNTTLYIKDFKNNLPRFIYYLLERLSLEFSQYQDKTGVPGLNRNDLHNIVVTLPPTIAEQTAIATALSDADSYISSVEQLIAKKRLIKQGAMQELLRPKEGWVVKRLGEVLKVRHGKSQKEIEDMNGEYPILASGGIIGRATSFLYDKPSVLIGRKGTIDKPQFMNTPFWSVDTLFFTEIFDDFDAKFIFYMFNLINWYSFNEASGVPSLNAKTIENIEKYFPKTKSEQTRIATILSDMDTEIEALEGKLSKARGIKQGMMQQLLTGKIRLL